jgi:hypothetical protein
MATMLAPKGTTQVSVEQQVFAVDAAGMVKVPDNFVAKLKDIGFKEVAQRIAVTPEAAAEIASAAAKLNLPDPQLTRTVQAKPAAAATPTQPAPPAPKPAAVASGQAKASIFPDDAPKEGETKSTEPSGAAPGALAPNPEAGATGNDSTLTQHQLKDAGV